ncbi:hypothetical protein FQN54_009763 [Arachnomyces sp. PD_36]|nr:hypothetical protein FQN54_009763 [Arachnomyces sp. PD_36]
MDISLESMADGLFWLQVLLSMSFVALTPKRSPLRKLGLVVIGSLCYVNLAITSKCQREMAREYTRGVNCLLSVVHSFSILVVCSLDAQDIPLKRNLPWFPPALKRLIGALEWITSPRGVGTRWQPKAILKTDGSLDRGSYVIKQALILGSQYLLNDAAYFLTHVAMEKWGNVINSLTVPPFRLSIQELAPRAVFTASAFVRTYFLLSLYQRTAALATVAVGFYSPEEWPAPFGSVSDAYTLRGYWGKFWHQMIRWPLTSMATFITDDVLWLPKHTRLHRYTHLTLVFTVSGLLHSVPMGYSNHPGDQLGVTLFFTCFSVGIIIEDAVQELWRRSMGDTQKTEAWKRVIGYAWVLSWFVVTGPYFTYPMNYMPLEVHRYVDSGPMVMAIVAGTATMWLVVDRVFSPVK